MAWLTEAEFNYWCDVYEGRYVRRPVRKPAPATRFDFDKQIQEAVNGIETSLARQVRAAASLEHVTAALRQSRVW